MGRIGTGSNRGIGNNWQRGHRRPRFSIHFYANMKELNHVFKHGFFNLVGQGILQPKLERPPFQPHQNFSSVYVPPHVSMHTKPPINDGWREYFHHPIHHHGWPTTSLLFPPPPPLLNTNAKINYVVSLVQSSHASKRLKTSILEPEMDKVKRVANPSKSSKYSFESVTSHMHHKYIFSHVISEIQPQGSNQPKAIAKDKSFEGSKEVGNNEMRHAASHNKYGF